MLHPLGILPDRAAKAIVFHRNGNNLSMPRCNFVARISVRYDFLSGRDHSLMYNGSPFTSIGALSAKILIPSAYSGKVVQES